MTLDYRRLMSLEPMGFEHRYSARDTMLYALGVGVGLDDPTGPEALRYGYEASLEALPTMAVTLGFPGSWLKNPEFGVDWKRLVHGDQSIQLHRPLPPEGVVVGATRVEAIYDKGEGKGAVLYAVRDIRSPNGDLIATVRQGTFLRGDGGFGGSSEGAPTPHPMPDRSPEHVIDMPTCPDQALLYRLSGDYNPLHADPEVARQAGFERPILHGLCSYGIAGRAVIQSLCSGLASRLTRLDVRFSSPVYPGDTLTVELWLEEPGRGAFRARVAERAVTVLQNGYVEFTP
jgi:acyl dehydratase